jgi:hypothetical protein
MKSKVSRGALRGDIQSQAGIHPEGAGFQFHFEHLGRTQQVVAAQSPAGVGGGDNKILLKPLVIG